MVHVKPELQPVLALSHGAHGHFLGKGDNVDGLLLHLFASPRHDDVA